MESDYIPYDVILIVHTDASAGKASRLLHEVKRQITFPIFKMMLHKDRKALRCLLKRRLSSPNFQSFTFLISPTVKLPERAAGSTSDALEDKRETPDCRGEGSHPWQNSAGIRLFIVGANYRSSNSSCSRNSS